MEKTSSDSQPVLCKETLQGKAEVEKKKKSPKLYKEFLYTTTELLIYYLLNDYNLIQEV